MKLPLHQYCISLKLASHLLDSSISKTGKTLGLEVLGRFMFLVVDMYLKQLKSLVISAFPMRNISCYIAIMATSGNLNDHKMGKTDWSQIHEQSRTGV